MERNKYTECREREERERETNAKSQQLSQTSSSDCIHLYANKCETTECSGTTQREGKKHTFN